MDSELIVGIDLGTTNSEIAFVKDGQPHVIPDDSGEPILPSFVGLTADDRLVVGRAARNQWVSAPERVVKSIKRKMGEDVRVPLGGQQYTPQEISAMILRTLRERAEKHLKADVRKAVITVPAYFNDAQRQATREAGELAGLEVVRILNEPTAASLCYDAGQTGLKRILVYDLGGGTFDVSIVQMEDGVVEVLSSHGDTQLGGDDFDQLLANHIAQSFQAEHAVDLKANPIAMARLIRAAEEAKKQLSFEPFAIVQEEYIAEKKGKPLHLKLEVARHAFEQMIRPLLDKTITCVGQALEDANLTPSQIDKVLLVGGSTRSPIISNLLEERLGQKPHSEVHPDLCVALGASIQAAIIAGTDVGSVLVDITPHTLGVSCLGELYGMPSEYKFAPIIPRNTALPASRSEGFCTVVDRQKEVVVEVFQGESEDVRLNTLIGKFVITGLAPVPAGNEIVTGMNLTLDGVLEVTSVEKTTGLKKAVRIENAMARFRQQEHDAARERIAKLFESVEASDPDETVGAIAGENDDLATLEERASTASVATPTNGGAARPVPDADEQKWHRSVVQANALLDKGERLLSAASTEDRAEMQKRIAELRQAIAERKATELQRATDDFADLLFYLEEAETN